MCHQTKAKHKIIIVNIESNAQKCREGENEWWRVTLIRIYKKNEKTHKIRCVIGILFSFHNNDLVSYKTLDCDPFFCCPWQTQELLKLFFSTRTKYSKLERRELEKNFFFLLLLYNINKINFLYVQNCVLDSLAVCIYIGFKMNAKYEGVCLFRFLSGSLNSCYAIANALWRLSVYTYDTYVWQVEKMFSEK